MKGNYGNRYANSITEDQHRVAGALRSMRMITVGWPTSDSLLREWMLVSGIADLVLAAIVITGFPGTLAWALGLLVGVDMIFGGLSLIAMGMAARRVTQG